MIAKVLNGVRNFDYRFTSAWNALDNLGRGKYQLMIPFLVSVLIVAGIVYSMS